MHSKNRFSLLPSSIAASFVLVGFWSLESLVYGMEEASFRRLPCRNHRPNYCCCRCYGSASLFKKEPSFLFVSTRGKRMGASSIFESVHLLLLLCVFFYHGVIAVEAFTGTYGINYGRLADNIPSPENVVKLLKASKLKNVRIYDADHSVLTAFKGSGLDLVIGVPNQLLKDMNTSEERAMSWVKENVASFMPETRIRGIAVGNEILGLTDLDTQESLVGAVKNVYKALESLHLKDVVEVSTPHAQVVFANSYPPSACTFKNNLMQYMKPLLQFLSQTGGHFYINIYPFLAYSNDPENIDINYALFLPNPGIHDDKTNLHYDNMFDATVDATYAALEAAGFGKMEVRVAETGWASKGSPGESGASVDNARIYNYNLRKRLALRKGTPFRPRIIMKAYVFALFNENNKDGKDSERNFGLFKADGSIAYDIGFSGLKRSTASKSLMSLKDALNQGWSGASGPYTTALTMCAAVLLLPMVP